MLLDLLVHLERLATLAQLDALAVVVQSEELDQPDLQEPSVLLEPLEFRAHPVLPVPAVPLVLWDRLVRLALQDSMGCLEILDHLGSPVPPVRKERLDQLVQLVSLVPQEAQDQLDLLDHPVLLAQRVHLVFKASLDRLE